MKKFINAALLLFIFVWFNGQKANGQYINVALPGNISQYSCGVQDYQLYESETAVDYLKDDCFEYKIAVSNSKFSLYADDCSTLWNFQFAKILTTQLRIQMLSY